MAYTKKTWVKGNTPLSAENFNHMEQGIADAHSAITQLNSDISGIHFYVLQVSGTTDEYGQLWIGNPGIDLSNVKFIDCLSNTFTRPTNPYGIINFEGIDGNSFKFRLVSTNNTVFGNYRVDKNVVLVYKN